MEKQKKTKKKLTVQELDLEQLEGVTAGTDSNPSSTDSHGNPYTMNTGKPLPILGI